VRRAAQALLGEQTPPVRCVIWDISNGGARLAVAHPLTNLPRRFTLLLSHDGRVRRGCEIVWIDKRFVGVKFV
jgi:hypothetical protein